MNHSTIRNGLGCGCVILLVATISVLSLAGFISRKNVRIFADPEEVRAEASRHLTAAALPHGYRAEVALKIPFLGDLAVLQGKDAQFVYLANLRSAADLTAAFANDESFDREIRRAGLTIRPGQALWARGSLQKDAAEMRYILLEGRLEFDVTSNSLFDFDLGEMVASEEDIDAQSSAVFLLRCSPDDEPDLGLWQGPRPAPSLDDSNAPEFSADESAFRALLEAFEFCPPSTGVGTSGRPG